MPENKLLSDAAKDVPQESSPAPEEKPNVTAEAADPAPDAGNKSGDNGSDDGKQDGRTLENVSGEFNRKITDVRSEVSSGFARMEGLIAGMQTVTQAAPAPATDINTMTSAQLEALAPSIPEEQKAAFGNLVATRKNEESVNRQVDERFGAHTFKQTREDANRQAFAMYPELHDPTSRVRLTANRLLNEAGSAANDANPHALFHAAKAAGSELGIKPKTVQRTAFGAPVGSGTAPAPEGNGRSKGLSDKKFDAIAEKLKGAMPKGKFTKEHKKSIQENSVEYDEHRDLFIKQ
ncbi:unnamed protein product [marine sediment metagenome]|uniref:Uncharacterized protein n=1 Tax=marine sediment metagenome TaxID=412755 RepID=X0T4J0_9ZZZZ